MNDCDATHCEYGDPWEDPNSPTDCNADPQSCECHPSAQSVFATIDSVMDMTWQYTESAANPCYQIMNSDQCDGNCAYVPQYDYCDISVSAAYGMLQGANATTAVLDFYRVHMYMDAPHCAGQTDSSSCNDVDGCEALDDGSGTFVACVSTISRRVSQAKTACAGTSADFALAEAAIASQSGPPASTWPSNSEFCVAWAKYAVCATWRPHETQADCEQARSGCTYTPGNSNLQPWEAGYNAECNAADAASAAAFSNYDDVLSSYWQQTDPAQNDCTSKDQAACDPSTTDCFWRTYSGGGGGSCTLKSAVANSTLTSSGAPPGMIAYDAVGDYGGRLEAECSLHNGDEAACGAAFGCEFQSYNNGACQTPDWYDLWVVLDACVDDITSAEADTVAEAGGVWGGMAHLTAKASGLPYWPTNAQFCDKWAEQLVCYGSASRAAQDGSSCPAHCIWDSNKMRCNYEDSTFFSFMDDAFDTAEASSVCQSSMDASTCVAQGNGDECVHITFPWDGSSGCVKSITAMRASLQSASAPISVESYVVTNNMYTLVCNPIQDEQTCDDTDGCSWRTSSSGSASCGTNSAYRLLQAADACADVPNIDFDAVAVANGYADMSEVTAAAYKLPSIEELCDAWEADVLCGGRFVHLTEAECANSPCAWDVSSGTCGHDVENAYPQEMSDLLSTDPAVGPMASNVSACAAAASNCNAEAECFLEADGTCNVKSSVAQVVAASLGYPGNVFPSMVAYEFHFAQVCGTRADQSSCENGDLQCTWDATASQCSTSSAYALATAANACVDTFPRVDFSGAASALGTTMDAAFTASGVVKSAPTLASCTVVAPANGTLGACPGTLQHGETCTPACNSGHVLSGESACNDGTLVPAVCLPPCTVVAPANGQLGNCTQELPRGETCVPSCDAGFTLSGSLTCDGGGTLQPAFCMPRYFTTAEFCPAWEAQIFCSFSDDAVSCSAQSQCAWDGNAGECVPSGTLLKSALASTEAMMQMALSDESTACSGLSSANCSAADNCTWWSRENSCEVAVSTIQDALTRDDAPITAFAYATLDSMERSCNGVVDESECASRPDCEPVRNDNDGSFDFCGMFEPRYLAFAAVECVGTTATFESAAANMSTTIHEVQDSVFSFPDGDTFCAAWEANITCASVNITANCNSTQSCAWNVDDGVCEVSDVYPVPTPAEPDVVCVTLNETWCESTESCRWTGSSCVRVPATRRSTIFDDSRIHRRGTRPRARRSYVGVRVAVHAIDVRDGRRRVRVESGGSALRAFGESRRPAVGRSGGAARRHRDGQARLPPTKGVRCPA